MMAKELITPEMAKDILERLNTRNRALSEAFVGKLVRAMRAGEFKSLLSTPIKFYEDGALADGQHRLAALARAAQPLYFYVLRGVTVDEGRVLDIGRNRSSADRLSVRGVDDARMLAAIARSAMGGAALGRSMIPASAVEDVTFANQDRIRSWAPLGRATNAIVAAVFMMAVDTHGEDAVREVCHRVTNRIQNGKHDPVTQLNRLIDDPSQFSGGGTMRAAYFGKVASCLQAALEGRECKQVKILQSWPKPLVTQTGK